ncbi:MAG: sugar transporter [Desulfuromonas sp.]|nr:MAG: sugar transporter [Desulfuromonas sp.]
MIKLDLKMALSAIVFLSHLVGCSSYTDLPAGTVLSVEDTPVISSEVINVEPIVADEKPAHDYRVGSGDVLYVNVQGVPEMGSPVMNSSSKIQGNRIDGEGNIHLPLVGSVHIAGQTVSEVEATLRTVFSLYLNEPWVVVEVAEYHSQPIYLIGQFRNSGTVYMERPLTLLQGISEGGGLLDTANLSSARLVRGDKTMPVDLYALLNGGSSSQNVWLQSGDTIYVPDDKNLNVFVFGAVDRPGPVSMPNGQLTLPQALASAEIDDIRGHGRYIRIIRSHSPVRGELLVVDLDATLRGRALPFVLKEGDIVYVPRSKVGNWNEAIEEILPSLQLVSAMLAPFVQIEYLSDNN